VLIYDATLPSQRTAEGTLGDIASRVREGSVGLLVVGAVTGLRQHLRWFDERPLFGKRIVVTRSRDQAGELIEMLEERGAEAVPAPAIRILPPEDLTALDQACLKVGTFDWIVFASADAVDHFMDRLLAVSDVRELKGVRICPSVRSPRAGCRGMGSVDLTPPEYRAKPGGCAQGYGNVEGLASSCRAPTSPARSWPTSCARPASRLLTLLPIGLLRARPTMPRVMRYLPDALGQATRCRDVHEPVDRSPFRPAHRGGARGRSAANDRRRVDRSVTAEAAQQFGIATDVMPERYTVRISSTCSSSTSASSRWRNRPSHDDPGIDTERSCQNPQHRSAGSGTPAAPAAALTRNRALVRETRLSPDMFLYPLFVRSGSGQRREMPRRPGVYQLSVDEVVKEAAAAGGRRAGCAPLQVAGQQGCHRIGRVGSGCARAVGSARAEAANSRRARRHRRLFVRVPHTDTAVIVENGSSTAPRSNTSREWRCLTPRPAPTSSRRRT
jgi:hypothetical protein